MGRNDTVQISRESVIAHLQLQKAGGSAAWQRLQMVKDIQCDHNAVLRSHSPPLDDICETLNEFARRHPVAVSSKHSVIDVAGKIDPNEPEPVQQLRRPQRLLGRFSPADSN